MQRFETLGFVPDLAARSLIARRGARPAAARPGRAAVDLCRLCLRRPYRARRGAPASRRPRYGTGHRQDAGRLCRQRGGDRGGPGPALPGRGRRSLGPRRRSRQRLGGGTARRAPGRTRPGLAPSWLAPVPLHHPGRGAWRPDNRQRAAAGPAGRPGARWPRRQCHRADIMHVQGDQIGPSGGSAAAGPRSWPAARHPHHTPAAGVALADGAGELVRPVRSRES